MKKILVYLLVIAVALFGSACNTNKKFDIKSQSEPENDNEILIYSYKPDTLCPIASTNQANIDMLGLVYDGLIKLSDRLTPIPSLAESWKTSDDGHEWTIYLRKSVKWHKADDNLSADDVIYTIQNIKALERSAFLYNVSKIASVDKIDDLTLKITITEANPNFINLLYFPIIKKEENKFDLDTFNPVGTGPYMLNDKALGDVYTFVRNEKWWGGAVKASIIKAKMLPTNDTALYSFGAGNLDLVPVDNMDWGKFIDPVSAAYATIKTPVYNYIGINHQNTLLSMPELRRAVSLVIDREKLIDDVRMGYAVAANAPARPEWFICENQKYNYKKDVDTAKKILLENNWIFKDGVYQKVIDGTNHTASFSLLINEENVVRENLARIISQELQEFGINVDIIRLSFDDYLQRISEGKYDAFIGSTILSPDLEYSSIIGDGNVYNFSDDEISSVANKLKIQRSDETIKSGYAELINLFEQINPIVGLFFEDNVMVYTKKIKSEVNPSYFDIYSGLENMIKISE